MPNLTITEITQAIADTLSAAQDVNIAQALEAITEGIQDAPLLQVYHEHEDTDPSGETHQTTFKGGVQQSHQIYYVDCYARQRAHIGHDMAAVAALTEAVRAVLAAQKPKPYFGLEGIQSLRWEANRVQFEYAAVKYAGVRFEIEIRVF